jgi:hypothetical protein
MLESITRTCFKSYIHNTHNSKVVWQQCILSMNKWQHWLRSCLSITISTSQWRKETVKLSTWNPCPHTALVIHKKLKGCTICLRPFLIHSLITQYEIIALKLISLHTQRQQSHVNESHPFNPTPHGVFTSLFMLLTVTWLKARTTFQEHINFMNRCHFITV